MAGFGVVPPGAVDPGGFLNPSNAPFWGLNEQGQSCNEDLLYYPDPWDTFWINDDQLPGKCWVEGKDVAQLEIVKRKGKGMAGAKIALLGYEPGEFNVLCRIATPEQWQVLQSVRNKYWAGPAKATKPPQATVNVKHPDLNSLRIFQAVVFGVPLSEPSDVEGAKHFRFRFHEQVKQRQVNQVIAAAALPPEDPRQPASASLNGRPEAPSSNPENASLSGPVLPGRP
jgi:hypothetical protein